MAEGTRPRDAAFLQRVLDSFAGIVYVYDLAEQRNVYVNERWVERFGYTIAETQAGADFL
ncbi:MAG: hypothetical protein IT384_25130 [Deltaproteobacteria bacterium]|nr:hypothetical protein [Deltaproteobacteria bacterium]